MPHKNIHCKFSAIYSRSIRALAEFFLINNTDVIHKSINLMELCAEALKDGEKICFSKNGVVVREIDIDEL